ncbi:MAG TPA: CoA-binding protein [Candidatus Limnocylindria bacterium]|nr:CoA-binding protein [Candidatus Limnocylindria bacterium]
MTTLLDRAAHWHDPEVARRILNGFHTWAVVGCSSKPWRASFGVSRYLISQGFDVVPVHPNETEVHGRRAYPDLRSAAAALATEGRRIEVVDLFRNVEQVAGHVEEAIEIGASAVWMQLEIWNEAAARRAEAAGLLVVMDRCPAIDGPQLLSRA